MVIDLILRASLIRFCNLQQKRNMLEFTYESQNRDITVSTRYSSLPFELKIKLPPPRKTRIINARDEFGRIIHSVAPVAHF